MQIKFRGKQTDNGNWAHGCFKKYDDGACEIMVSGERRLTNTINGKPFYSIYAVSPEVDPATVGQYINRKDDRGNEIIKGDICKITSCLDEVYIGEVIWSEASLCWALDIGEELYYFYEINDCEHGVEVIGNVFDNPELLEESNNG